eukprot:TRINITY_DN8379_c0_g1_i1.p1 TRINITY_DN8379_c0_g1~~TRINITY_DN8379_c0_g1_i1.p1  ORF type:complete len:215 (+),score=52.58 TRINITY_DN8379_c0_g1_i1:94-738(+)
MGKTIKKMESACKALGREFYEVDGLTLAKALLGKILVRKTKAGEIRCKIVETEAYLGPHDRACHAFGGKKTERTKSFYLTGGHLYVYVIYGHNNCINIVANKADVPEAILIRAVEPITGWSIIQGNRKTKSKNLKDLTNGPGKLSQAMNIDRSIDGLDLTREDSELYLIDDPNPKPFSVVEAKRINIDYAGEYIDKLWRFYIKDNKYVSVIKKE